LAPVERADTVADNMLSEDPCDCASMTIVPGGDPK
jgi:hypothetical protein